MCVILTNILAMTNFNVIIIIIPDNIALRRPTRQPSTCVFGSSERAVDGNTNPVYGSNNPQMGSCTHTCEENSPWWMVDFGQTALVHSINITNRGIRVDQK